ncbi:fimbrial protein [Pseudomonas chlororaphis]
MRRSVWIRAVLLFVAGCAVVNGAMARVKCTTEKGQVNTMVLDVHQLDAGPKVPLGEVYSNEYKGSDFPGLNCIFDSANEYLGVYFIPSSDVGGDASKIYKTNVGGLGISFINGRVNPNRDASVTETLTMKDFVDANTHGDCKAKAQCKLYYESKLKIVLVKTGSVKPGQIIDFPNIYMIFEDTLQRIFTLVINSDISVISKTCLANPVEVNMGAYSTRVFTGIGSTAPSKDFSIELTNCPAFDGPGKKNLKFRIDPVLSALNASNGVLRLDASASTAGTGAASGVGIQIVTAQDSPLPLGMDQDSGLPLRNTEANYSIPLRARYLQTDSKVTPGPAKATANFTIIYP